MYSFKNIDGLAHPWFFSPREQSYLCYSSLLLHYISSGLCSQACLFSPSRPSWFLSGSSLVCLLHGARMVFSKNKRLSLSILKLYGSMLKSSIYHKELLITWVLLSFLSINHLPFLLTHTSHQPDVHTRGFSGMLYASLRLFPSWFGVDTVPFLI